MEYQAFVNSKRVIGRRDPKIFGHFLEHFHDQIYGGVYNPDSPFADENGFRQDVTAAISRLNPSIIRWPGGCYVSAYHWEDGVGPNREPHFDKAWRVEESNRFGTDEFIALCRKVNAEPYICTNAGSGMMEEMSHWVEYCNLRQEGKYAKRRIENGYTEPHRVKYWSIGNENYLPGEIGAKAPSEWGLFVREAAKMMKRVDPTIQLLAASVPDLDWNINLLREAGRYLDWVSIHGYWDPLWQQNRLSNYETCMGFSTAIEQHIAKTIHILGSLGFLGKVKIAFDEWNLRGWHHPHVDSATEDYVSPRELNNLNASYTMADAVFSACFLNQCLRYCRHVGMANFAPTVNTRGMIYAHQDGIVLRSTYFVFELFTSLLGDTVVDSWLPINPTFEVPDMKDGSNAVDSLDLVATVHEDGGGASLSIVNRHPEHRIVLEVAADDAVSCGAAELFSVLGKSKDSCNDIGKREVGISRQSIETPIGRNVKVEIQPHSVNVLVLRP